MIVGVPRESYPGERRVALVPGVIPNLAKVGLEVVIEAGAGLEAGYPDADYTGKGAQVVASRGDVFAAADIVVQVLGYGANDRTGQADVGLYKRGQVLIGFLRPMGVVQSLQEIAAAGVTSFSVELMPRITRAQSMDALSSMATIAGYKAVLIGADKLPRIFPMLTTAAGTITPSRVLVIGAGVAGLQAIATAKRLGAVIEASDVRPAVKEQIESLGAKFLDVPYETDEEREAAVGVGGYARPMPPSWLTRQSALVHERAKQADIVISTALIPGRAAPTLLSVETVQAMKPGSVLIDLAAGRGAEYEGQRGGNCPLTEADKVVVKHGVTIAGYTNLASMVASDASALYARNLLDFMKLIVTKEGALNIDLADDIVAATLLARDGEVTRKA